MSYRIRTGRTAETIGCINFDGGSLFIPAGLKSKEPAGRPPSMKIGGQALRNGSLAIICCWVCVGFCVFLRY